MYFQATDFGAHERRWRAERGAASTSVSDQSAESRQRFDYRRGMRGRNLPEQPTRGAESRSSMNTEGSQTLHNCLKRDTNDLFFFHLSVFEEADGGREGEGIQSGGDLVQSAGCHLTLDPGRRSGWSSP